MPDVVSTAKKGNHSFGEVDDLSITHSKRVVLIFLIMLTVGVIWAKFAVLDEVSTGTARVVPTSREQVIQSLEGGILSSLHVTQDELVEPGQLLAQLDPTRNEAEVEETTSRYRAVLAQVARLEAEIANKPLVFPDEISTFSDLIETEKQLYTERRRSLNEKLSLLDSAIDLTAEELAINERLRETGASSNIDVIRLRRQSVDLAMQRSDVLAEYQVELRTNLADAEEEIARLLPIVRRQSDVVTRLTLRSPVRGIVKGIEVSTVGGVVPPNGRLMNIIPIDDQLMIEARITPRDIAFIRPGLRATIKISAYDYAIFGGLDGVVLTISPDTLQDESNPELYYYRVLIETQSNELSNDASQLFSIVPGMVATVEIHTGQKTVLDYLLKPFRSASEALRER